MMLRPEGVFVALTTPMHADERINGEELRRQVDRFIQAGVNALFCLGTNGEFYALDRQEKIEVLEIVREQAGERVPVCAGVGCVTTAETVAFAREAERLGADAVSVITPYFVALGQEQLYSHFRTVAEAVELPVILYNIPARTGNTITPETLERLSVIPNVIGIKDSSGKLESVQGFIEAASDGCSVLAGTDSLVLPGLRAGASGTVSGLANVVPELLVEVYRFWKMGADDDAERSQARLTSVREILKLGNPNSITKRAVNLLGFPVGPCRAPAEVQSPEVDAGIREVLSASGVDVPRR